MNVRLQSLTIFTILVSTVVAFILAGSAAPSWNQYRHFSITTSYADSTVGLELVPALTGYRAWVESVGIDVTDNETGATVTIQDSADTPILIGEFSVDSLGGVPTRYFGRGISCSVASAVMIEFSGTSTEVSVNVTGHYEP
jgi:hypothetical protein